MQSLLKEISMSSEKLQVLDHGDKKFLFAHGEYSTTVLITSKDLKLLRMKISKFHNEFEKTNGEILKNFTGKISQLKGINSLMDNVFKTDLDE